MPPDVPVKQSMHALEWSFMQPPEVVPSNEPQTHSGKHDASQQVCTHRPDKVRKIGDTKLNEHEHYPITPLGSGFPPG